LASVLDAHAGLDRWARVHSITARLSIGGPFWGRKGWPEIFGDKTTLEFDAHRQHIVVTPFNGVDRRSVFDVDPERIVICINDGIAVERRDDPRTSFGGYEVTTPWDALQVGYFISYASWNYLTAPFLFTYPGVETRELSLGRRTGRPGGVCTLRSPDRSRRTARSRSSITTPPSCNGGWITPWRSTATFSSPSISTSRRPSEDSSSPLNAASTAATQTGPPTKAKPRSRSTSPTSQSTPTNSAHQRHHSQIDR